jgi:MFS family permease
MSIRTLVLILLLSLTLVKVITMNIADPLTFVCTAYASAILFVATIASILAGKKANKAKESSVMPIALITLILATLATPASAFAQAVTLESDMVSTVTTSVIANAFTALILGAFVAGAFTGIYTIIAKNRKTFQFGVTAVLTLLGAALFISLAGMLLPYTATGYVAQDMVAITMFSAIVLLTGMSAVVNKADNTLTAKEKAAIAAEKARIEKINAEHNAKIDAAYQQLGLEASLEAGYKYSIGISQRIINEKKAAALGNGCYKAFNQKHGLGVEIDWSYGVSRSRYMGYWPNEK